MCIYLPYITALPPNCGCNHRVLYYAQEAMKMVLLKHHAAEGECASEKYNV